MVLFTACFTLGVWLLQQQAALPDFGWAWLLLAFPLVLLIPAKPLVLRVARSLLLATFALGLGFSIMSHGKPNNASPLRCRMNGSGATSR